MPLSRRSLLAGAATFAAVASLPRLIRAAESQKTLRLQTRQIEVRGKSATRYRAIQPSGAFGLTLNEGDELDVVVENALPAPSGLHWHGLTEPWRLDGVPYLSAPPIASGGAVAYRFPAIPTGTRFMHSHFGLQEQDLLAAPLIIREKSAAASGAQEVVLFLEDFSWTDSQTLYDNLRKPKAGSMDMSENAGPDLNDVAYDAFLANDRTLDDPEIIDVEKNGEMRLRIINAAASTNFTVDFGGIEGSLVSVDGNPVVPLSLRRLPLAVAQRADIVLRMPADGTAVPVFAIGEGRKLRTGIVLRPPGASVARLSSEAPEPGPTVGLELEAGLVATQPLPAKPIDNSIPVDLTGTMTGYIWGMTVNDQGGLPATIDIGQRVELVMRNRTMMAHPMHLHGHIFQVVEINGKPLQGAVRDSVLVAPKATVKVVFDADNPGFWAFHCHNLYHMAAGMFATVVYRSFS
jgi:FtsP/CotA-like multicopper oxidase with cupredoxin domain